MNITTELGPPRTDGRCQIKLVFFRTPDRSRWAVPDVLATKAQWDTRKRMVRFGVTNAAATNAIITMAIERARALVVERPGISPAELREAMGEPVRSSSLLLHEAMQEAYNEHEHQWRHGTKKQRRLLINDARQALPTTPLTGFDQRAMLALDRWYVGNGSASNTRRNRLIKFGALYRMACTLFKVAPDADPGSIAPDEVKGHKVRLSPEQVDALRNASWDLPTAWMRLAAHTWLLQYDLGGLRFNEACRLNKDMRDGDAYKWIEGKVPKPRYHPVRPKAQAIIDYYASDRFRVLPLVADHLTGDAFDRAVESANTLVRRELTKVCELLGLPRVTTHSARHSAAHRMKTTLKDIHTTSKILGHAKVEQTRQYLDELDTTPIDEAFSKLD